MPKKEVFLTKKQIEYIDNNYNGKYSEFGRISVQEKIERESDDGLRLNPGGLLPKGLKVFENGEEIKASKIIIERVEDNE